MAPFELNASTVNMAVTLSDASGAAVNAAAAITFGELTLHLVSQPHTLLSVPAR